MALPAAAAGTPGPFSPFLFCLLLADYLPFLAVAAPSGSLLFFTRFLHPVVEKFLLHCGRNYDKALLTPTSGLDHPADPDLSGKTVLLPLFVPFQEFIQGPVGRDRKSVV